MALRAIIIDDEIDGVKSLKILLNKFAPEINLIAESTDALEGLHFIENYHPDIVFLDILMPELNGIDLVSRLTFRNFELVYTTAYSEFALQALKQGTTDYLLKPIDADDLKDTLNRIRKKRSENQPKNFSTKEIERILAAKESNNKILISDKEVIEYCAADDIIRLEANSNYTWVVFKNRRTMLVSKTMKDFEKQLSYKGSPFIRIHQSHIINLNHCLRYRKEEGGIVDMADDKQLSISPKKRAEFLNKINYR